MDEKLKYLKRFSPNIEIVGIESLTEEDLGKLPLWWKKALSKQASHLSCEATTAEWASYGYQLKSTYSYLVDSLSDIDLIKQNNEISLLYSVKNTIGGIAFYGGKNPQTKAIPPEILKIWGNIPSSFKDVYENLHNGWCYFASQSNGLSSVENLFLLDDMNWGILDEIAVTSLPFKLNTSIPFFSNGMGAYACLDIASADEKRGFVWYNNKPPKVGVDIWAVADEWTRIGIEK